MNRVFRVYDPLLMCFAILATLFGLVCIFDAGYAQAMVNDRTYFPPEFRSQLLVAPVAIIAGILAARVKPESWKRIGPIFGLVVLVGLIVVAKFGTERYGARRWILGIQPAEFAKLAVVLYLASIFADRKAWPTKIPRRKDLPHWLDTILVPKVKRWLPALWILAAVYEINKEPDLGTAAVVALVAFMMFFPGRVSLKSIVWAVILCSLGTYVMVTGQAYRMDRILNHSHRWDADNAVSTTFQTDQAELAISTGGLTGWGVGNGQAKHLLPAATTDFVMATVGEETGLLGSMVLLTLIGAIVWRLFLLASRAQDRYSMLILYGIACWIGVQSCVNFMMANAFLPAIGIPLPFISSGGSSLVALWIALGICQGVLAPAPDPASIPQEKPVASSRHRRRYRRPRLSRA